MSDKASQSGMPATTTSDIKYSNLRLDKADGVWILACHNIKVELPERVGKDEKPTIDADESSAYITTTDESLYEVKITPEGTIVCESLEEAAFSAANGTTKCGDGAGNDEDKSVNQVQQSQQCADPEKTAASNSEVETGMNKHDVQEDTLSTSHEKIPKNAVTYTDLELKQQDGAWVLTGQNSVIPVPGSNAHHVTLFSDDTSACIVTANASMYQVNRKEDGEFFFESSGKVSSPATVDDQTATANEVGIDNTDDGHNDLLQQHANTKNTAASGINESFTKNADEGNDKVPRKSRLEEDPSRDKDIEHRKQKQGTEERSRQVEDVASNCNKPEYSQTERAVSSDSKGALSETFDTKLGKTEEMADKPNVDEGMHHDSMKSKGSSDKYHSVTESSFNDFVIIDVANSDVDKAGTHSTTCSSDKHGSMLENFSGNSKVTEHNKGPSTSLQHTAKQQEDIHTQVPEIGKQYHIGMENTSIRQQKDRDFPLDSVTVSKESENTTFDNGIDAPFASFYQSCNAAPHVFDEMFASNKTETLKENKGPDVRLNEGESISTKQTDPEALPAPPGVVLKKEDTGYKLFVGGQCFVLPKAYKDGDTLELKTENGAMVVVTQGNKMPGYEMNRRELTEETGGGDGTASTQQQEDNMDGRDLLLLKDATEVGDFDTLTNPCATEPDHETLADHYGNGTVGTEETNDECQNRRCSETESGSKSIHSEKGITNTTEKSEIMSGTGTTAGVIECTHNESNLFETTGEFSIHINSEEHLSETQTCELPCHEPFMESSSNISPDPDDSNTAETTVSKNQKEIKSEHASLEGAQPETRTVDSFDTGDSVIQQPDNKTIMQGEHTTMETDDHQHKQDKHVTDKDSISQTDGQVDLKSHQIDIDSSSNLGSSHSSKLVQAGDNKMKDRDSVQPSTEMSSEEQRGRDARLEEIHDLTTTPGNSMKTQSFYGGARPKQNVGDWMKSVRGGRSAGGDHITVDMAGWLDKGQVQHTPSEAGASNVGLGKGHATADDLLGSERMESQEGGRCGDGRSMQRSDTAGAMTGTGLPRPQYKDTGVASLKAEDSMKPPDKQDVDQTPTVEKSVGEECVVTGVDAAAMGQSGDVLSTYEIQYSFFYYISGQSTRKKMEKKIECDLEDYFKWKFVLSCPRKIEMITTTIFEKRKVNAEMTLEEMKFKEHFYNVDMALKVCESAFKLILKHTNGVKVECFQGLQKPEHCAKTILNSGFGSDKTVLATALANGDLVCVYEADMEVALHGYFKKELNLTAAGNALKVPEASRPSTVNTFSLQLEVIWMKLAEQHPIKENLEKMFSGVEVSFEIEDESCAMMITGTQDIAKTVIKQFQTDYESKMFYRTVPFKMNCDVFRETNCCLEIQAILDKARLKCVVECCDGTGLKLFALDQKDIDSAVRKVSHMMKEDRIILHDKWKQTENFNKLKENITDVLITVVDSGTSAVVTGMRDKVATAVNTIKSRMAEASQRTCRTFMVENRDHFMVMKNDRKFLDHLQHMYSVQITEIDIGERQGFEMNGNTSSFLQCECQLKEYMTDIVKADLEFNDMETTTWLKSDEGELIVREIESNNCVLLDWDRVSTNESDKVEIELDSKEAGQSTWRFSNGHKLIVYRVLLSDAQTEFYSQIVEVDKNADVGKIMRSAKSTRALDVNIPKYVGEAEISQTKMIFKKLLESAKGISLAIEVPMLKSWTLYGLMTCLVQGIGEYFLEVSEDAHPVYVVLCPGKLSTFETLVDDCQKAVHSLSGKPCTAPPSKVNVCVKFGSLSDIKADVLVNTTSSNLDLSNGAVSKALSRKAGPKMQDECNTRFNKNLSPGELAVTKGYNLDCRHVFHCSIPGYKGRDSLQHITQIVTGCLIKATEYKATSIAFPAIGTGNLSYPVDMVAAEMFDCVDRFINDGRLTSLDTVLFVVYSGDTKAVTHFRRVEEQRIGKLTSSSATSKPIASPEVVEKIQLTLTGRKENVQRAGEKLKEATTKQCQTYYLRISENVRDLVASKTGNMEKLHRSIEKLGVTFIEEKDSILLQAESTQILQKACLAIKNFCQEEYQRYFPIPTNFQIIQRRRAVSGEQYELFCFFHSSLLKKCYRDQVKVSHHGDTLVIDGKLEKVVVIKTEMFRIIDQLQGGLFKKEIKLESGRSPKTVERAIEAIQERSSKVYFTCDDTNTPTIVYVYGYERELVNEGESAIRQKLSEVDSQSGSRLVDQAGGSDRAARKQSPMESLSYRPDGKAKVFETREKLVVKVYQGNLLEVGVDAIVNAANTSLQHYAGVAAAIADAAGEALKSESTNYVRAHRNVPVGTAIKTTAGKLPFKCVIHAVGPDWSYYGPYTVEDIKRCQTHLSQTIYNSLLVADKNRVLTVAIPAISSALFGVPKDLCAAEYAEAVIHYSEVRFNKPGQFVREVHFVDKDEEMVKKIAATFKVMIEDGKPSPYNMKTDVRQTPKHNPPMNPNRRSSASSDRGNTGSSTAQKGSTQPGLAEYPQFLNDGSKLKCRFNENHEVLIYSGDILSLKGISAIVCSEDPSGNAHGIVAKKLLEKGKHEYERAKKEIFKRNVKPGDVLMTTGGKSEFHCILHALVPQQTSGMGKRWNIALQKMLDAIFDKAALNKFPSVVMALLGTGSGGSDPTVCARALLDSYTVSCNRNCKTPLVLHVVNIDTAKTHTVKQVFQNHVQATVQGDGIAQASATPQPSGMDVQSGKVKYSDVVKKSEASQPSRSGGNKQPAAKPKSPPSTVSALYPKLPAPTEPLTKPKSPASAVPAPTHPLADKVPASSEPSTKPKSPVSAASAITYPPAVGQPDKSSSELSSKGATEEQCVICMDKLENPKTLKCGHKFCTECIDQHFKFKQTCPVCGAVLGIVTGDQPDGQMEIMYLKMSLAGHEGFGTIGVSYSFKDGKQGPDNARPGSFYAGISRTGYLPDTVEGRKVCAMLKQAFKRRLIFTIGRSRTTGQEGVITWNDIHHKTDHRPNSQFGYPDPGYLDRVKDELGAKGITEANIDQKFLKKLTPGDPYRFIIKTDKK